MVDTVGVWKLNGWEDYRSSQWKYSSLNILWEERDGIFWESCSPFGVYQTQQNLYCIYVELCVHICL